MPAVLRRGVERVGLLGEEGRVVEVAGGDPAVAADGAELGDAAGLEEERERVEDGARGHGGTSRCGPQAIRGRDVTGTARFPSLVPVVNLGSRAGAALRGRRSFSGRLRAAASACVPGPLSASRWLFWYSSAFMVFSAGPRGLRRRARTRADGPVSLASRTVPRPLAWRGRPGRIDQSGTIARKRDGTMTRAPALECGPGAADRASREDGRAACRAGGVEPCTGQVGPGRRRERSGRQARYGVCLRERLRQAHTGASREACRAWAWALSPRARSLRRHPGGARGVPPHSSDARREAGLR